MTENVFKLKTRSQMHKKREFQRVLIRKVDVFFEVTTNTGEKIRTKSLVVAMRAIAEHFKGLDPKGPEDDRSKSAKAKDSPRPRKKKSPPKKSRAKKSRS